MNERTTQWTSLALCLIAGAASALIYPDLPERIATHWNILGQPDQWSDRRSAVAFMPGVMLLTWLLLWGLPKVSPAGWRIEPFQGVWGRVQLGMLAFFALLHIGLLGNGLGWFVTGFDRLVIGGVGMLLLMLGNYLGKTTRNFFFGIRTPWTLASDEVWRRTHRLGGWLVVGAGCAFIGMAVFGTHPALLVGTIVVMALVPFVYSYFAYRQVEGFEGAAEPRDDDPS